MSKFIKSNRIEIDGELYKLSPDITISTNDYLSQKQKNSESQIGDTETQDLAKNDQSENLNIKLIEKAEDAAIEILDEAELKASQIIDEAIKKANEIETEAMEKSQELAIESKKKGYQDGYNEAYKVGKKEADMELEEVLEIKKEYFARSKDFLIDKEDEIIRLVLAVSKKVLAKEIEDLGYIEALTQAAMDHLGYATSIVIRVSEYDLDVANLIRPKILAMAEKIENLEIKADLALEAGSCVIDTPSGSIDASIKTQIERIEDLFKNILASREPEIDD